MSCGLLAAMVKAAALINRALLVEIEATTVIEE